MKNKGLIITGFAILIALTGSAGIVGLLESKKETEEAPKSEYKVTYEYFLDEEKIDNMPINADDETKYAYSRYSCTNRVEGEWINNEWKFIPNLTADTKCKIYFVSTEFEMSFKIQNGTINGLTANEEDKFVVDEKGAAGTDFIQEIIPTDGYSYKDASCSDNNEISWDKDNNELTIKNIKSSTLCTVNFEVSTYEVKTIVENGSGASSLTIKHNEDANITITPSKEYTNPTISCTNKQNASWANNKLTVSKVTNNTVCTVKFALIKYDVQVNVTNGTSNLIGVQKINSGESKSFILTPSDGHVVTGYNITGCENATKTADTDKLTITFNKISKNETCNVTFQASQPADNE